MRCFSVFILISAVLQASAKGKRTPVKGLRGKQNKVAITVYHEASNDERSLQKEGEKSKKDDEFKKEKVPTEKSKKDDEFKKEKVPTEKSVKVTMKSEKEPTLKSVKEKSVKGKLCKSNKNKLHSAKFKGILKNGFVQNNKNKGTFVIKQQKKNDCFAIVDEIYTKVNTPVIIPDLLENDNIPEGQTATIESFTQPKMGSITILNTGETVYTPNTDFIGTDTYDYTVLDNLGNTHIGTVIIYVEPLTERPVPLDDFFNMPQDSELIVLIPVILGNDFDPDGDTLSLEGCTDPRFGVITIKGGESNTYIPNLGFVGTDFITCTIIDGKGGVASSTITFIVNTPDNTPFGRDDIYVTDMGSTLSLPAPGILANDNGIESGGLSVIDCADPSRGSFTFDSSGSISYVPDRFFLGIVTIECTLDNGRGGRDTSRVIIAVRPPFFGEGLTTDEDSPLIIVPSDIGGGTINSCNAPTFGTLERNPDGTFTYTPKPNFNGQDTFECTVTGNGGSVDVVITQVTIKPVGDKPIAFPDNYSTFSNAELTFDPVQNDIDADGDVLSLFFFDQPSHGSIEANADQSLTYIPDAGFLGTDTFDYTVSDGNGGISSSTVSIIVNSPTNINTAPTLMDDSYTGVENTPLTVGASSGLLANDFDADGDFLIITTFTKPSGGSLALSQDGSFVYIPNTNFVGTDVFEYVVFDGIEASTGTVSIVIQAGSDAPATAIDDNYSTPQGTVLIAPASAGFLANDFNAARLISVSNPASGNLAWNSDGSFTYAPFAWFVGLDSFSYTIVDTSGRSSTGKVNIAVTIANLPDLIIPGENLIDLTGKNATKRVSSDCTNDFTDCKGVNTVEEEESSTFTNFGK